MVSKYLGVCICISLYLCASSNNCSEKCIYFGFFFTHDRILTYTEICLTFRAQIFSFSAENSPAAIRGVPAVVARQSRTVPSLIINQSINQSMISLNESAEKLKRVWTFLNFLTINQSIYQSKRKSIRRAGLYRA